MEGSFTVRAWRLNGEVDRDEEEVTVEIRGCFERESE
jgi:hypothetical protein